MTAPEVPWKGLDTSQKPVFISYDQVERMIAALLPGTVAFQPDEVVGIARGGIVPASMAAGILALPLTLLTHDKATGGIAWIGSPAVGQRILLVDDCCSSGTTLRRARASLLAEGHACLTMVVVHDPDVARYTPDLSHPMRQLFRLPWERGEATPTGRAAKAAGGGDLAAEAPFVGIALDASLLAGIAAGTIGPPPERAVLIGDIPASERARAVAVLATTSYRHLALECHADALPRDPSSVARAKADAAIRWGCTHFIERDAEQAIAIAAHAPHLIVTLWSDAAGQGWVIGAAALPPPPAERYPKP